MKTKTAGTLLVMSLSILACGALLSGAPARACTVFCYSQGDTVLVGRSLDIPDNPNLGFLFVPATNGTHGLVCGGRFGQFWADGMNDQGLFVAMADVPAPYTSKSSTRPTDFQAFLSGLLGNCATVDEAIKWCSKQPTPSLAGSVTHSDQGDYTFATPQHLLVADRSGNSVVFEWPQGKLKMTRKRGRYQLITNYLLSDPEAGAYPCPRFIADSEILKKAAGPALQTCRQVLETTSAPTTRYSLIYDLTHGDVHVYLRRGFEEPKTFHLADELQKGRHELDLGKWFGKPEPEPLSPPPIIAAATIPASEILQRALTARGGAKAAAEIRSLHAKGTINIDWGCVRTAPIDYFAMRPNQYRQVIAVGLPKESHPGQFIEGFDGRTGWSDYAGMCEIPQGAEYEQRKYDAEFFGWCDEPDNNKTAECLGEAQFDGKPCYVLKMATPDHHEAFHYYDKSNFLLIGIFSHDDPFGPGWVKTTFCDYRAFEGFLMPTRIVSGSIIGYCPIQFTSFEINKVKEKDLQMSAKAAHLMESAAPQVNGSGAPKPKIP